VIGRKLQKILQELELVAKQGNVEGFLNNAKNADKVRGLVGDIGDAVMDYQVCCQGKPIMLMPNTHFRLHYNKTCMKSSL